MSSTSVAVVVEQRDAAARRLQDVVLGRPAAVGFAGKRAASSNVTGEGACVVGRRSLGGRRAHADAWPPYAGSLGFVWL